MSILSSSPDVHRLPTFPRLPVFSAATLLVIASLSIAGCGSADPGLSPLPSVPGLANHMISGMVHGGQQPVAGATIALYAAGTTGTASAARSILTSPVATTRNGNFTISGFYSCQPGDQIYIVATGGDSGGGSNNSIALMAALGPCATLMANASTTFIDINEVTTVGSVYALSAFMSGLANVGSDSAHSNALAAAFANTQTMVNTSTGQALQVSTGNGMVPYQTINSLANSIASCINSTSGSSACADLFKDTAVGGSTPADTVQATLNIAHNPALNTSPIYLLATATPPFQPTLTSAPASYALTVAHPSDVLTYHNDSSRTGVQPYESALTPSNVNVNTFGKLYSLPVDSYLFAQPLYVGGIGMPDGVVHNLVIAASTHATVYAFDADNHNPAAGYLWSKNFLPAGERYPTTSDRGGCPNPPESGIVGTPVIDRPTQTIYFVTKTITTTGAINTHRLHAVSLLDGSEQPGSPVVINPSFAGTGSGSSGGVIAWDAGAENERAALLLAANAAGGKTVWIAYASHCDGGNYHGDVLGYDYASLALTSTFINTPNGVEGGIWMGAGGPASDAANNLYVIGGNGTFDIDTNGGDYGESVLRLVAPAPGSASTSMTAGDYFTPSNQVYLNSKDLDTGGTEPILFDDPASGTAPHLLIASDKNSTVYLLNRDRMGTYRTGSNGADGLNADLQEWNGGGAFIYNFAFFNNTLYTGDPLRAWPFVAGTSTTAGHFITTSVAQGNVVPTAPTISANGTAAGLVWAQDTSGQLHALTTPDLNEIYNTTSNKVRDAPAGGFVKFTSPIIANGKVFLSGQGAVTVYGLLP